MKILLTLKTHYCFFFLLWFGYNCVFAAQTASNFTVIAYFSSSCSMGLAIPEIPAFPFVGDTIRSPQTGYFMACLPGTYTITASTGSGSYSTRTMQMYGTTNRLNYNIYVDSTYSPTQVWGDGTGSTKRISQPVITVGNTPLPFYFYIEIPSNQSPLVGSYSDTITVTLTYS